MDPAIRTVIMPANYLQEIPVPSAFDIAIPEWGQFKAYLAKAGVTKLMIGKVLLTDKDEKGNKVETYQAYATANTVLHPRGTDVWFGERGHDRHVYVKAGPPDDPDREEDADIAIKLRIMCVDMHVGAIRVPAFEEDDLGFWD